MSNVKGIKHIFHSLNGDQNNYVVEEGDIVFCAGLDGKVVLETCLKFHGQDLQKLHSDIFMVKKAQKPQEDYNI